MNIDVTVIPTGNLRHDAEQIRLAEQLGFDAAWTGETAHNPFFPLTIASNRTRTIQLGTQTAAAFPRSPMVTAQIAWDLARQTDGRFVLGLGTQVQAHLEGGVIEEWSDPVGRTREYIESLRAIWNTFQTDARLRYRGEHYQFRLMAPFFNPGPISNPAIPIYLAGANPAIFQLAGEFCQGLHAQAFHTPSYLRQVVLPAVESGLRAAERVRSDFAVTTPVLVVSGSSYEHKGRSARAVREHLAYCAGTPACRRVMSHHGWDTLAEELSAMACSEQWQAMTNNISDEVLNEFAIVAEPEDVFARIVERYYELADRVCIEWNADDLEMMREIAASATKSA